MTKATKMHKLPGGCFTGWKPDLPDQRDHIYAKKLAKPVAIPDQVNLSSKIGPCYDQGDLGSCTGNSIASLVQFLHPNFMPSRLMIYYDERAIENTIRSDAGAEIRDGIKSLNQTGVCSETSWPYDIKKFKNKPAKSCFTEAANHKITQYSRLSTLDDMLNCLAQGFPFVFGFTVYESFESDTVAKTGIVPMPGTKERTLGGHAVSAFGYDKTKKMMIVRNSWGVDWALKGYFLFPFDYISNTNLCDDIWTVRS